MSRKICLLFDRRENIIFFDFKFCIKNAFQVMNPKSYYTYSLFNTIHKESFNERCVNSVVFSLNVEKSKLRSRENQCENQVVSNTKEVMRSEAERVGGPKVGEWPVPCRI